MAASRAAFPRGVDILGGNQNIQNIFTLYFFQNLVEHYAVGEHQNL